MGVGLVHCVCEPFGEPQGQKNKCHKRTQNGLQVSRVQARAEKTFATSWNRNSPNQICLCVGPQLGALFVRLVVTPGARVTTWSQIGRMLLPFAHIHNQFCSIWSKVSTKSLKSAENSINDTGIETNYQLWAGCQTENTPTCYPIERREWLYLNKYPFLLCVLARSVVGRPMNTTGKVLFVVRIIYISLLCCWICSST